MIPLSTVYRCADLNFVMISLFEFCQPFAPVEVLKELVTVITILTNFKGAVTQIHSVPLSINKRIFFFGFRTIIG